MNRRRKPVFVGIHGNDLHAAQHGKLRYAVQCMAGMKCHRGKHVEVFDVTIPSLVTKKGEYGGGEFHSPLFNVKLLLLSFF